MLDPYRCNACKQHHQVAHTSSFTLLAQQGLTGRAATPATHDRSEHQERRIRGAIAGLARIVVVRFNQYPVHQQISIRSGTSPPSRSVGGPRSHLLPAAVARRF